MLHAQQGLAASEESRTHRNAAPSSGCGVFGCTARTVLRLNVKSSNRGRWLRITVKENFLTPSGGYGTTRGRCKWDCFAEPRTDCMHELPVTQAILDTALRTAQQSGAARIVAIDLVIGELSGIVDDSVQFYFDVLSQGTPAQGATLRFQRQPASAVCLECGHSYDAAPPLAPFCPACGSLRLQVTGGRQFFLESIEIDDQDSGSSADFER